MGGAERLSVNCGLLEPLSIARVLVLPICLAKDRMSAVRKAQ